MFTNRTVKTIIGKSVITALVHIEMWIYFCFRKLIDTDNSSRSLPSNVLNTVQKVFKTNPLKDRRQTHDQLSLFPTGTRS